MSILSIKICRFKTASGIRIGGVVNNKIYDMNYCRSRQLADERKTTNCYAIANSEVPPEMNTFIQGGQHTLDLARQSIQYIIENGQEKGPGGEKLVYALTENQLLTPLASPTIFCMGVTYESHMKGGKPPTPDDPNSRTDPPPFFLKPLGTLVGPEEMVVIPKAYSYNKIGWGTELTVVFGKSGKNISEERAYDYIYGYTILNDVTAGGMTDPEGKSIDTFSPVGPWIVPKDQISNPQKLALKFRLNGEEKQNGSTSELLFPISMHIRIVASYCRINIGDILATGSLGVPKPQPLRPGDIMEAEIEDIGILRNPTKMEE